LPWNFQSSRCCHSYSYKLKDKAYWTHRF